MPKVGKAPDFADDGIEIEAATEEEQEVKDTEEEDSTDEEATASEPSTDDKADDEEEPVVDEDAETLKTQLAALDKEHARVVSDTEALKAQKEEKMKAIVEARRTRREAKDALRELPEQPTQTDVDISDIDTEDVARVERILKARGYVQKQELQAESFKEAQIRIEKEFFEQHPEYKEENDADNTLYDALRKELALFSKPSSPEMVKTLLERAHREVATVNPARFKKTDPGILGARRQKAALAGAGAGTTASSPQISSRVPSSKVEALRQHLKGFDDDELADMASGK